MPPWYVNFVLALLVAATPPVVAHELLSGSNAQPKPIQATPLRPIIPCAPTPAVTSPTPGASGQRVTATIEYPPAPPPSRSGECSGSGRPSTRAVGHATVIGAPMAAPAGCPRGALCVYSGINFTGSHSYLFDCNRTWVPLGRNDIGESWYNNGTTGKWARIWQNINFTGNGAATADHSGVSSASGTGVDNQGSSNDWPTTPFAPPPLPSQCPG